MSVPNCTVMSTSAPSGCTERCKIGMYAIIGRKVGMGCPDKVVCWSRVATASQLNQSPWADAREARTGVTFE